MSSPLPELRVIPAQLSFLAIYNPSLAKSDETFEDQILFYYSRAAKEAKAASKAGGASQQSENELKEQENERLRQVGLAQGIINFGRTFASGQPVDSVETAKSRIVTKELENGWWALASIDLTRLPKAKPQHLDSQKEPGQDDEPYEYSSREVSPPGLLIQQILTAHRIFLLHHGPSLSELMQRNSRERLVNMLDRYWAKFCRSWEVLLHGNPAVDALDGTKLSAGGELGMGVGEEEWGSGEREVLEDLVHRTEGLVDMVVSRFGDGPGEAISSDELPWIGMGQPPEAGDGVLFGGVGAISRAGIRDVSCWMQQIYTLGEYAYGVKDNPVRKRRRRGNTRQPSRKNATSDKDDEEEAPTTVKESAVPPGDVTTATPAAADLEEETKKREVPHFPWLPADTRPAMHDRVASHDHAPGSPSMVQPQDDPRPSIPPPIVTAAESALAKATQQAEQSRKVATPSGEDQPATSMYSDKWVKYLTLGLSTLVKSDTAPPKDERPPLPPRPSTGQAASTLSVPVSETAGSSDDEARQILTQLDPIPDGYMVESQIAQQKHLERQGYFLIGFQGPLRRQSSAPTMESDEEDDNDVGGRLLLRTIHVEQIRKVSIHGSDDRPDDSSTSTIRYGRTTKALERVRVVIYIRRPFIYALMFEQRTSTLQMSSFYSFLHDHLASLHKPLNRNTSPAHVAQLIEESAEIVDDDGASISSSSRKKPPPIHDLLYDPQRLTIHSSIPNIPLPGTHAAEGLASMINRSSSTPTWTRIEALNVHSQILSTLDSTKHSSREIERSAKTSRGWWVVWMRLAPSSGQSAQTLASSHGSKDSGDPMSLSFSHAEEHDTALCRVAVLVRKATDWVAPKASGASSRSASGMFGFGRADDGGGANGAKGPAGLAAGMGFDARRYVEGLLSLNR